MASHRRTFLTIAATSILLLLGVGAVAPAIPGLAARHGSSTLAAGLVPAGFAVGRVAFTVPGGILTDRLGIRVMGLASGVTSAIAAAASALGPPLLLLVTAQVVQGTASAAFTTGALTKVATDADDHRVGSVVATYQTIILFAVAFSPSAGSVAVAALGTAGPFWLCALAAWLATGTSLLLPSGRPTGTGERTGRPGPSVGLLDTIARSPALRISMLVAFASAWSMAGVRNTLVPILASDALAMGPVAIGATLTAAGLASVIGVLPAGRVIDRVGRRPVTRWGMSAVAVTVGLHLAASTPAALVLVVMVAGVSRGGTASVPSVVASDVAPPELRGAVMGVTNAVLSLGLALGPVTAGWLDDGIGTRPTLAVATVGLALAALVAHRIPETRPIRA